MAAFRGGLGLRGLPLPRARGAAAARRRGECAVPPQEPKTPSPPPPWSEFTFFVIEQGAAASRPHPRARRSEFALLRADSHQGGRPVRPGGRAATGEVTILDFKTGAVDDLDKARERARDSLQLDVYALAWLRTHGHLPARVELRFLESGVVGRQEADARRGGRHRGDDPRAGRADPRARVPGQAVVHGVRPVRLPRHLPPHRARARAARRRLTGKDAEKWALEDPLPARADGQAGREAGLARLGGRPGRALAPEELEARGAEVTQAALRKGSDLVFAGMSAPADLARLPALREAIEPTARCG